jgi:hypothetical protein
MGEAEAVGQRTPDLPTGRYTSTRNVHIRPSGNSRAAFLRRLRKDRPDIHARVLAGELSPHASMIEAGFRKQPVRNKADALPPERQQPPGPSPS